MSSPPDVSVCTVRCWPAIVRPPEAIPGTTGGPAGAGALPVSAARVIDCVSTCDCRWRSRMSVMANTGNDDVVFCFLLLSPGSRVHEDRARWRFGCAARRAPRRSSRDARGGTDMSVASACVCSLPMGAALRQMAMAPSGAFSCLGNGVLVVALGLSTLARRWPYRGCLRAAPRSHWQRTPRCLA